MFERLEKAGWQYSIGVRMIKTVRAAVEAIDEDSWQRIDYPEAGEAQIAETVYDGRRLIVRRTRLLGAQAELFPDWRHFCFITNRDEDIALVEAEHREHAVVEQAIADLKDQALAHFPSGHFHADGAWTVLAALAHNLLRWTQLLGSRTRPSAPAHPPPPAAQHSRPPDAPRPRLDAAPPGPLALARRLHHRPDQDPSALARGLTRRGDQRRQTSPPRRPGTITAARQRPIRAARPPSRSADGQRHRAQTGSHGSDHAPNAPTRAATGLDRWIRA